MVQLRLHTTTCPLRRIRDDEIKPVGEAKIYVIRGAFVSSRASRRVAAFK